jgi:hypothetical protein
MQKWKVKSLRRRGKPTGPATASVAKTFGTRCGLGISNTQCPKRAAIIDRLMAGELPLATEKATAYTIRNSRNRSNSR